MQTQNFDFHLGILTDVGTWTFISEFWFLYQNLHFYHGIDVSRYCIQICKNFNIFPFLSSHYSTLQHRSISLLSTSSRNLKWFTTLSAVSSSLTSIFLQFKILEGFFFMSKKRWKLQTLISATTYERQICYW